MDSKFSTSENNKINYIKRLWKKLKGTAVKINIIINILVKTQKAKEPLVENQFSQYIRVVYN
jgi:hypothetical protein